jgi:hypothetical protein
LQFKEPQVQWNVSAARAVGGGDKPRCYYNPSKPTENNVQLVDAGSQLSIIFTTFGINLPRVNNSISGVLAYNSSCNLEIPVVVPQGTYVKSLTQTVVGGIIKEKGTSGGVAANAYLFQNAVPVNQVTLVELDPRAVQLSGLFSQTKTREFAPESKATQCALTARGPATTTFKYQLLSFGARRPSFDPATMRPILPAFLFNLDAADFTLQLGPELGSCL